MKKERFLTFVLATIMLSSLTVFSQTLYVPGGTSGISNNTYNGNIAIPNGKFINLNGASDVNWKIGMDNPSISDDYNITIQGASNYLTPNRRFRIKNYNGNELFNVNFNTGQVNIQATTNGTGFYLNNSSNVDWSSAAIINVNRDNTAALQVTNNGNSMFVVRGNGVVNAVKIYSQGFEVRTDALNVTYPDYVFNADYKMMNLSELKTFIEKNKHLPNIPTAADVQKGYDLVQMDAQLLKKIEELTIYVIKLNDENEALRQEVEKLSK